MNPFIKLNTTVAAIGLVMACSAALAQTAAKPAAASAPAAKPATAPAPAANSSPAACLAAMNKATTAFATELAAGVKSGKIDAKEKADLDAKHAALLKKEAAAKADGKITAAECNSILAGIHAEHATLVKDLATAPVKTAAPATKPAAPASKK
jgi:uncharacterized membrane protein YebE (DUF533 family)